MGSSSLSPVPSSKNGWSPSPLTDIPQMDATLSVILPPVGFLCKAKPLLLQIGGSSLMGVARSVQNSLIFPSSGRTSPLVFARTTTERLTPVRIRRRPQFRDQPQDVSE